LWLGVRQYFLVYSDVRVISLCSISTAPLICNVSNDKNKCHVGIDEIKFFAKTYKFSQKATMLSFSLSKINAEACLVMGLLQEEKAR
jgi:hypothetical protein